MSTYIGPPVEGKHFIGRIKVVAKLIEIISSGMHILLSAPRRVGKTSIAKRILYLLRIEGWSGLYVSVEGQLDELAFARKIIYELKKHDSLCKKSKDSFLDVFKKANLDIEILGNKLKYKKNSNEVSHLIETLGRAINAIKGNFLIIIDELPVFLASLEKKEHGPERVEALLKDDKFALPWYNLGNLYQYHLKDFEKAEQAYTNATKIDDKDVYSWNGLGNLYQDHLGKPKKAKEAYANALELDSSNIMTSYNLIFLLRDILQETKEAENIFKAIDKDKEEFIDTHHLHESLFHIYDNNYGLAESSLSLAIEKLDYKMPVNTFDDWCRYVAIAVDQGFGENVIQLFTDKEIKVFMRPYFEAAVALQNKDDYHFQDIAAELRETAQEIYEYMKKYRGNLFSQRDK